MITNVVTNSTLFESPMKGGELSDEENPDISI